MEYLLPFIVGWCGTYWPWRLRPVVGGGPDDPWPPYCPVCGQILGGLAAIILEAVAKDRLGGGFQSMAYWFFAGAVASSLVGALLSLGSRGRQVGPSA